MFVFLMYACFSAVKTQRYIDSQAKNHQFHFLICALSLLQMKITYDDQYLITVSEDACVMIWKIQDKEGRGLKRDKEVGYAEEILITKSDLEEKVNLGEGPLPLSI